MRSVCTATRAAPTQLEKARVQQWQLSAVKKITAFNFQTFRVSNTSRSHSLVIKLTEKRLFCCFQHLTGPSLWGRIHKRNSYVLPEQLACFYVVYKKTWLWTKPGISPSCKTSPKAAPSSAILYFHSLLLCPFHFHFASVFRATLNLSGISGREMIKCSDI